MINYCAKTKPSGELLLDRLTYEGYNGQAINWGYGYSSDGLNKPEAIEKATNKRLALELMTKADVPTPKLYMPGDDMIWPVVGRRDQHTRGSGFFICYDQYDYDKTRKLNQPPTHYLQFIGNSREFRVHIFQNKSIKISEKIGTGIIRNYSRDDNDIVFSYPALFKRKQLLRSTAKQAVEALGLDFGAVDILFKAGQCYVLEVNSAPQLTEADTTLEAYVSAFMSISTSQPQKANVAQYLRQGVGQIGYGYNALYQAQQYNLSGMYQQAYQNQLQQQNQSGALQSLFNKLR